MARNTVIQTCDRVQLDYTMKVQNQLKDLILTK